MLAEVISCKACEFKNRDTGEVRTYYKLYVIDSTGGVGYVSSSTPISAGEDIELEFIADNQSGKLICRMKR